MVFIRNLVGGLLAELEDDIDHDRFKRLLHYSRRLASFLNRAKLVSQHAVQLRSLTAYSVLIINCRCKQLSTKSSNKVRATLRK